MTLLPPRLKRGPACECCLLGWDEFPLCFPLQFIPLGIKATTRRDVERGLEQKTPMECQRQNNQEHTLL